MQARRWLGYALIAAVLLGGRAARRAVLLGQDGRWRDPLWLESVLPAPLEAAVEAAPPPTGPFDVNTAPTDTLVYLPGIGPRLAERIVASRERAGPFADLDDLQRVKGIGPKLAARLSAHVVFGPLRAQPSQQPADSSGAGVVRPASPPEGSE